MVQIYSPEGTAGEPDNRLTSSVPTLDGLRIGVLDNEKPNAGLLMKRIVDRLVERGAVAGPQQTKLEAKAYLPCPGEVIEYLADNTDLVLTGSAD